MVKWKHLIIFFHMARRFNSTAIASNPSSLWTRLGAPRFISAPMFDHSELAFRILVRRHGCDLAFTQMMHSKTFASSPKFRQGIVDWGNYVPINHSISCGSSSGSTLPVESTLDFERECQEYERNLIVQLAGDDPATMIAAARHVQNQVAAVDVNLGCPQKIAKKGNYGSFLLEDRPAVLRLLSAMSEQIECAVTVKIRLLKSGSVADTVEYCKQMEQAGVQMITVHGRTQSSCKQFTGPADWDAIRAVKAAVSIPVVANGGVSNLRDALACLEHTGADAVMSSEALLENPRMFSEYGDAAFERDYVRTQLSTITEYLQLIRLYGRLPSTLSHVRGHLFKFLYRFVIGSANEDVRLGLVQARSVDELEKVVQVLRDRVKAVAGIELSSSDSTGMAGGGGGWMVNPGSTGREVEEEALCVQSGVLGVGRWYDRHLRKTKSGSQSESESESG